MWQTLIPELVTEIIVQSFAPEWELSLHKPSLFPWHLGHICRAWRSVFVSTPRFWSNPTFDNRGSVRKSLCHFEYALSMTKMCMERSRDDLLSFRFSILFHKFEHTPCCHKILETLVSHSTRWHDVYLTLPTSELQMLYTAKNRLPALRSIELTTPRLRLADQNTSETTFGYSTFSDLIDTLSLLETPSLEKLSIRDDPCLTDSTILESITFNFFHPLRHLKELVLCMASKRSAAMITRHLPRVMVPTIRKKLSQCSQARYSREVTL